MSFYCFSRTMFSIPIIHSCVFLHYSPLSDALLPGDIVSLPRPASAAHTVPCDIVLLRGECVVNESLLTGESVPQIKESLLRLGASGADMRAPLAPHDRHKNYVLCGGTQILLASCRSSSSSSSSSSASDEAAGAIVSSGSGSGSASAVPGAQYESVMAKIKSTHASAALRRSTSFPLTRLYVFVRPDRLVSLSVSPAQTRPTAAALDSCCAPGSTRRRAS